MTRPPRRKSMSPQAKTAASLCHDRRNDFGESDTASRKAIPLAKARAQRKLRRADKADLRDPAAAIETVPLIRRKPGWKKTPEVPLGHLLRRQRWRHAAAEARAQGAPEPERPVRCG